MSFVFFSDIKFTHLCCDLFILNFLTIILMGNQRQCDDYTLRTSRHTKIMNNIIKVSNNLSLKSVCLWEMGTPCIPQNRNERYTHENPPIVLDYCN